MSSRRKFTMPESALAVALLGLAAPSARTAEPTAPSALEVEQAQAREFGVFFRGTASQFDLCVARRLLPKSEPSAEAIARTILKKVTASTPGPDQSVYVQQGWDFMKTFLARHAADFTQAKCSMVAAQWERMLKTMTPR